MDVCRCCKSAHKNLSLSHLALSGSGNEEDLLSDAVLKELGETSLSWFEDLTESYLSSASSKENNENVSSLDAEKNWSPCPRGGVAAIRIKGNVSSVEAQLCSSKVMSELGTNNRSSSCGNLCTSNADLSWTSAMATPLDIASKASHFSGYSFQSPGCTQGSGKSSGKTEISSPLKTPGSTGKKQQNGKPKVLNRMLFSPGQKTWSNDSLSRIADCSIEEEVTVEQEETICSERDSVIDNTLDLISACNDETLKDDQDTLTAPLYSATCLNGDQSIKCDNKSLNHRSETKTLVEKAMNVCNSEGIDSEEVNVGTESEFSDSFTAEEMEMVEDDCKKQTDMFDSATAHLIKTDPTLPPTFKVSPTIKATAEKDKNTITDSTKHPRVESILAMIFPSQSYDSSSDPGDVDENPQQEQNCDKTKCEQDPDNVVVKMNVSLSSKMLTAASDNACEEDNTAQNQFKAASSPISETYPYLKENSNYEKDKLSKIKDISTPQSILKHLQTPRSSVKKHVRFSISSSSTLSWQSENAKTSSTDMILAEASALDGTVAVMKNTLDSNETPSQDSETSVTSNADVSKLLQKSAEKSMPYDSPSQDVLVSSQIEDISDLYSNNDNGMTYPTSTQEYFVPSSESFNEIRNTIDVHSRREKVKVTTPAKNDELQDNCTTNEFVFDDLSPSLSPAFPSQILSMPDNSEEPKRTRTERKLDKDETETNGVTEIEHSDLSNNNKKALSNKSDPLSQNINKEDCSNSSKSSNVHIEIKTELSVSKNSNLQKPLTSICMLEDGDDDIMCAAAQNAESHSELNHQVSSIIPGGNQTDNIQATGLLSPASVCAVNPVNLSLAHAPENSDSFVRKPQDVKSVIDSPCVTDSHNSLTPPSSITKTNSGMSFQGDKESNLKTIALFTTSKRKKFIYPAAIQKQIMGKYSKDECFGAVSTVTRQEERHTTVLISTEFSPHHRGTRAHLPAAPGKLQESRAESKSSASFASSMANTNDKISEKADFSLWKNSQPTDLAQSNQSSRSHVGARSNDQQDEVKELRLKKSRKSSQGFLGFAKFSDVFEDTEDPVIPAAGQEVKEMVVGAPDTEKNMEVPREASSPTRSYKITEDKESNNVGFWRHNAFGAEKTTAYGGNQSEKDNNHTGAVAHKMDNSIGTEDDSADQGNNVYKTNKGPVKSVPDTDDKILGELEDDFPSQMWTTSEFSQMELDAGEIDRIEQTCRPMITESRLDIAQCVATPGKRSFSGEAAKFKTETTQNSFTKLSFGFSSPASFIQGHMLSDVNPDDVTGHDYEVNLESLLEDVIKAKKVSEKEEEKGRSKLLNIRRIQLNKRTEITNPTDLENHLEQVLQSRGKTNTSTVKEVHKVPFSKVSSSKVDTHASTSAATMSRTVDQGEKAQGGFQSDESNVSKVPHKISDTSANKLSTCGFKTAAGKSINMSVAAQNKARMLWDSVSEDVQDHTGENIEAGTNIYQTKLNSKEAIQPIQCGFTTAGGKEISMSVAAQISAQNLWESVSEEIKDGSSTQLKHEFSLPALPFKVLNEGASNNAGDQDDSLHGIVSKFKAFGAKPVKSLQEDMKQNAPSAFDKRHKGFQPFKAPKVIKDSSKLTGTKLDNASLEFSKNSRRLTSQNISVETGAERSTDVGNMELAAKTSAKDVGEYQLANTDTGENYSIRNALAQSNEKAIAVGSVSSCASQDQPPVAAQGSFLASSEHLNISEEKSLTSDHKNLVVNKELGKKDPQSPFSYTILTDPDQAQRESELLKKQPNQYPTDTENKVSEDLGMKVSVSASPKLPKDDIFTKDMEDSEIQDLFGESTDKDVGEMCLFQCKVDPSRARSNGMQSESNVDENTKENFILTESSRPSPQTHTSYIFPSDTMNSHQTESASSDKVFALNRDGRTASCSNEIQGADVTLGSELLKPCEPQTQSKGSFLEISRDLIDSKGEEVFCEQGMQINTVSDSAICDADKHLQNAKAIQLQGCHAPILSKFSSSGFSTASGKAVSVSEKSLRHVKAFFDDDGADELEDKTSVKTEEKNISSNPCSSRFSTAPETSPSVSEESISCAKTSPEDNSKSSCEAATDQAISMQKFSGFSTASGKSVSVSEKSRCHAETILDDDAQSLWGNKDKHLMSKPNLCRFSSSSETLVPDSEKTPCDVANDLISGDKYICEANTDKTVSKLRPSGFSTASGKKVSGSGKALSHAKTFLDEDGQNVCKSIEKHIHIPCPSGFTTASGISVSISEKALVHARTFLHDDINSCQTEVENSVSTLKSSGFSTAAGKSVTASEESLYHARIQLDNDAESSCVTTSNMISSKPSFSGFSTAAGKSVTVAEKSLCHVRTLLENDAETSCATTNSLVASKPSFSGFSTAGSKSVSVSEKALHHAKSLFDNTDECPGQMRNINTSPLCATDNQRRMKVDISADKPINLGVLNMTNEALGNVKAISRDEAQLADKMDLKNAQPCDRPAVLCKKFLTPLRAKCDEFQYDRSNQKIRKLSVMFSSGLEDKVESATLVATDNKVPSTFKPPYKKVQPDASGDSFPVTQGQPERGNIDRGKAPKFIPPPALKSSATQENLGQGDGQREKQPELKGKPVFRPLKSAVAASPSVRNAKSDIEQKGVGSSNKTTSGRNGNVEKRYAEHENANEEQMKCDDLDNEAENELLCSDFTSDYIAGSNEGSIDNDNEGRSFINMDSSSKTDITEDNSLENRKYLACKDRNAVCRENKSLISGSHQSSISNQDGLENSVISKDLTLSKLVKNIDSTSSSDTGQENERKLTRTERVDVMTPKLDVPHVSGINESNHSREISGTVSIPGAQTTTISSLEFEEAVMAQEKLIRNKKRRKVQPCCGRWLETRKKGQGQPVQLLSSLAQETKQDYTYQELLSMGVCPSALTMNSLNAKDYRFNLHRFFPSTSGSILIGDGALLVPDQQGSAGAEEFYKAFWTLDGVDPSLCEEAWLENHFRWLVWKLAAYEVYWPSHFAGRCLTPDIVMLQLKYRYDREVDACNRSAIKKIVERDDTPSKRMVLCVASIDKQASGQPVLKVTDGWYSIKAQIDGALSDLVSSNKIGPRVKIVTSGAELVGSHEACSPLEIPESLMLKLSGNSTRPARWHDRLGYCAPSSPMCVPLVSLHHRGGTVGCVDVVLSRKYPAMYMEKLTDGACIFRTLEEEEKASRKHEEKRQEQIEKLYSALQIEKEKEPSSKGARRARRLVKKEIEKLWSGQELAEAMESALNPEDFQQCLSTSQMERLTEFKRAEADRRQQEINLKLQKAMSEAGHEQRNVVPVQKFRVNGCCRRDIDSKACCVVTVWRPGADWIDMKEGRRYRLYSMTVGPVRGKGSGGSSFSRRVTLTATRQSRLQEKRISDNLLDLVYEKREVWSVSDLKASLPKGNEFDFVGLLIKVKETDKLSQPTVLYVCDSEQGMLSVNIWPGRQSPLPSNACPGQVLCMCSLFLRQATSRDRAPHLIPILAADARPDFSSFSMSAHSSCHSSHFTHMELLAKKPEFLLEAQNTLENQLSRAQASNFKIQAIDRHTDVKPELSVWENNDEDFPPDVVEKIFSNMSQGLLTGGSPHHPDKECATKCVEQPQQNLAENEKTISGPMKSTESARNMTRNSFELKRSSTKERVSTPPHLKRRHDAHSGDSNKSESSKSLANTASGGVDDGSEIMKKRKLMLRQKMSRLLSYESPSPLSPLLQALSPASRKDFKTPVMKKTL